MFTVTIKGFHSIEHAQAFADWYDMQGEQIADDWLDVCGQPSAYVTRPHLIEENGVVINVKPKEEF